MKPNLKSDKWLLTMLWASSCFIFIISNSKGTAQIHFSQRKMNQLYHLITTHSLLSPSQMQSTRIMWGQCSIYMLTIMLLIYYIIISVMLIFCMQMCVRAWHTLWLTDYQAFSQVQRFMAVWWDFKSFNPVMSLSLNNTSLFYFFQEGCPKQGQGKNLQPRTPPTSQKQKVS